MTDIPRGIASLILVTGVLVVLSGVSGAATFDSETDGLESVNSPVEPLQNESWTTPGTYSYDVSDRSIVAVTLAGAGGGGGAYDGGDDGGATDGGAGGAVEAVFDVSELSELQIYVGEGGGGGENATAGAGGLGRATGGDGGLDAHEEFGFHAAGGGGGGSTEVLGDGDVVLVGADGGGGGAAWDEHGNICCDDASGGGGGAGGSAGISSGDRGIASVGSPNGTAGEPLPDRPGFGGDGGDANSGTETATAGDDGGVWTNTTYLIDTVTETDGGGATGGTRTAELGTSGGDGSIVVTALDPRFEIQSLASSDERQPGEEIVVTATITNTGGFEGTQRISLDAEQLGTDSEELSLAEGETTELTFTVNTQPGDDGSYTLTVETANDVATTPITLAGEAVGFELRTVAPEEPTVTHGASVEFAVDIENLGSETTTQNVSLTVAGEPIATEPITLSDGESDQFSFTVDTDAYAPGEYVYTVTSEGAELTGWLLIEESETDGVSTDETDGTGDDGTPDDDSDSGAESDGLTGPILGIGTLALFLLIGVILVRRRSGDDDGSTETDDGPETGDGPETDDGSGAEDDSEMDDGSETGDGPEMDDSTETDNNSGQEDSAETDDASEMGKETGESDTTRASTEPSSAEQSDDSPGATEERASEDADDTEFDESGFEWGPPGGNS